MGRVFIYTDGVAKENLVVPLVCAAVYLPDDFVFRQPTDSNAYRLSKVTARILKEQWDNLIVRHTVGFNDMVLKYGVYGTSNCLYKKALLNMKVYLLLNNIKDYEVFKIERLDIAPPEAKLAYAVTRFVRDQWFERYAFYFKGLDLSKTNGNLSKNHLLYFSSYCRLPDFYIWDRALRAARNIHPTPPWAINELNHYQRLIGDNNGNH